MKRGKGIFVISFFLIFTIVLNAQIPTVQWAKFAGGEYNEYPQKIVRDSNGNIYVVGYFDSPSVLFGSNNLTNSCAWGAPSCMQYFLVKYNSQGDILWAKGAPSSDYSIGMSVALDNQDNVIVAGFFRGYKLVLDSYSVLHPVSSDNTLGTSFIAKYNSAGNVIWAKGAENTNSSNAIYYCETDLNNNIYFTGHFQDSQISFGGVTLSNSTTPYQETYLMKLDPNGNGLWGKSFSGDFHDVGKSICTDKNGNVFITGYFMSSSLKIGGVNLINKGISVADVFVSKFNSSGSLLWAKSGGGTGYDVGNTITSDNSGNAYLGGEFKSSSASFGSFNISNPNTANLKSYIVKYDQSGNESWVKSSVLNDNNESVNSLKSDNFGNIYAIGYFTGNSKFDNTTLTSSNLTSSDIFLNKYNSQGNVLWATKYGGSSEDRGQSISIKDSSIYMVGMYKSPTIKFDNISGINFYSSYFDIATVKLDIKDTIPVNYCSYQNQVILSADSGYNTYVWTNQSGIQIGTTKDIAVSNPTNGSLFTVTMSSSTSSKSTVFKIVRYDTTVDFIFTNNCVSNTVNFTNLSTTNKGNLTYLWDFGDGTTSTSNNPTHTYLAIGTYKVKLTIKNADGGCEQNIEKNVETFIPSDVKVTGNTTFCYGEKATLTATGAVNYKWSTGSTSNSIDVNKTGKYWLIGSSTNGICKTDTIFINVIQLPDFQLNMLGDSTVCEGENAVITASGATSYEWNTGEKTPSVTLNKSGVYTVKGTNSNGCSKTKSVKINILNLPSAEFTITPSLLEFDVRKITVTAVDQVDVQYNWNFGDGSIATGNQTQHTYNISENDSVFTVTLTAINKLGCEATKTKLLRIAPLIPNVFTPNNDGINDVFVPNYEMKIFDRNGLILYSGTNGWDGTFKGKPMDPDAYFYYISYKDADNKLHVAKGYVTLIR